jgi:hypothetical protein
MSDKVTIELKNLHEIELLLAGLDQVTDKTVVAADLRKRLKRAMGYFSKSAIEQLAEAAKKRDLQRRRDGRG